MGDSEKEKIRLRLDESDLSILENMTAEAIQFLSNAFNYKINISSEWPKYYHYNHNNISYEFVFSQMGSITFRLSASIRYKKNPPPIFYASIGKYSNGSYVWEDFMASEMNLESMPGLIQEAMKLYEEGMANF
jgi:hypothetical protein